MTARLADNPQPDPDFYRWLVTQGQAFINELHDTTRSEAA